jgi:phosphoenolpyruvate phosphomutase
MWSAIMKLLRLMPRFKRAYRELRTLEAREGWSRSAIETFQLERLNAVWEHAVLHVPHYRRLAAARNLPPRFASLDEFAGLTPALPRQLVRDNPKDFLSEQAERGWWMRTSGSTGTPMSGYWSRQAHQEMLRGKYRMQAAWGVDFLDRAAFLWGHSSGFRPGLAGRLARLKQPLEDRLRGRLRLSAYELGQAELRQHLSRISAYGPAMLYGFSRALAMLAREAELTGFACQALKLAILTGEPAYPAFVQAVERGFGVPAAIEYGSVECGFLAGQTPDRALQVREDLALLETLPRDDGRHDILVTVLNNPSFPLLRYAIGDVTDQPLETPERGFRRLHNVAGRDNDLVLSRTGRPLHSARFEAALKCATAAVRGFRIRQHADGLLNVLVELNDPQVRLDLEELREDMEDLVEGYPVQIEVVQQLPVSKAGKHRLVMSDLDQAMRARSAGAASESPPVAASANGAAATVEAPPAAAAPPAPNKASQLRALLNAPELSFIMEAHNGLSARIVEEAGFAAIWASGLSISASLGVRDSNEASWTQVLEVLEFMSDSTRIPILVDGDTGYGNFNNMRRLVRKLEQRNIGGVCIEDKLFPKTNSFLNGTAQPLADAEEFCGRIRAGKDAQRHPDFVIVARVEALIAGWGMKEALRRAEAYHRAGADAILIHSAQRTAQEVLAFKEEWGDRLPVVIVPTKYYATPTDTFRQFGFAAVIWANHLLRSAITAMQRTAQQIHEEQTLLRVEDRVAPLAEVFRLQGTAELEEAEKRYLPNDAGGSRAILLAAARGLELGELTEARPKCMLSVSGMPLLRHGAAAYRAAGVKDLVVVRGYRKDTVAVDGARYFDNPEPESTGAVFSLYQALSALEGPCVISFGDVLFKKYVPEMLLDTEADFAIAVDTAWRECRARGGEANYVACSAESDQAAADRDVRLLEIGSDLPGEDTHGRWMGFLKVSATGASVLRQTLLDIGQDQPRLRCMGMSELLRELVQSGKEVRVVYTTGHWLEIETPEDVLAGSTFQ